MLALGFIELMSVSADVDSCMHIAYPLNTKHFNCANKDSNKELWCCKGSAVLVIPLLDTES